MHVMSKVRRALPGTLLVEVWDRMNFDSRATASQATRFARLCAVSAALALATLLGVGHAQAASPPLGLTLTHGSVAEEQPSGAVVGVLATSDPDAADSHTYLIVEDDAEAFALVGDTLVTRRVLDFETDGEPEGSRAAAFAHGLIVRVRSVDPAGLWREQSFGVVVEDVAEAPLAVALTTPEVSEVAPPGTRVGRLAVDDRDGDEAHTFEFFDASGAFELDGDELVVRGPLDFETSPVVRVTVRVTDAAGLVIETTLDVALLDADEPATGVALSGAPVLENAAAGASCGTLVVVGDPDVGETFVLTVVGAESTRFAVAGNRLVTLAPLDFEAAAVVDVSLLLSGSRGSTGVWVTRVVVGDVDEAPLGIVLGGPGAFENDPSGSDVGGLVARDDAGAVVTFTRIASTPDVLAVVGDRVVTTATLDHETTPSVTLVVRVRDALGRSLTQSLVIAVQDRAEAPSDIVASNLSVPETTADDLFVATLAAVDPDAGPDGGGHTFAIAADASHKFRIVGNVLRVSGVLDAQATPSLRLTVRATDVSEASGLSVERELVITVIDVDQDASDLSLSGDAIDENRPAGTTIGSLRVGGAAPPDGTTFTLVGGPSFLEISGADIVATARLDHETTPWLSAQVWMIARGTVVGSRTFQLSVRDRPEPPVAMTLAGNRIAEGAPIGTVIGRLMVLGDPDAGATASVFVDDGAGAVTLVGGELVTTRALDFEAEPTFAVRVHAIDDSGLRVDANLTIDVADVNEPPRELELVGVGVAENAPAGTVVGTLVAAGDPEGDGAVGFALLDPGAGFALIGDTLVTTAPLDHEAGAEREVALRVRDAGGAEAVLTVVVQVRDRNEPPGALTLDAVPFAEGRAAGSEVARVVGGMDPDSGDVARLEIRSLVIGGRDASAAVAVEGQRIVTTRPFDSETEGASMLTVAVVDRSGLERVASVALVLLPVNEAPVGLTLTNTTVPESAPATSVVGRVQVSDDSPPWALRLTLSGAGSDVLALDGDRLVVMGPLDARTRAALPIRISISDDDGSGPVYTLARDFVVTVLVNAPPTFDATALAALEVEEDEAESVGLELAVLVARLGPHDPDGALEPVLTLAPQVVNGGRWEIGGGAEAYVPLVGSRIVVAPDAGRRLRFVPDPDVAGRMVGTLLVGAWDGLAASARTLPLDVEVGPVNDPPSIIAPGALTTLSGVALPLYLTAGGVADPFVKVADLDAQVLAIDIVASHGEVTLEALTPAELTHGAAGRTRLRGPLAALAASLARARYVPDAGFYGDDEIRWTVSDEGQTGLGGTLTAEATTAIRVEAAAALELRRNEVVLRNGDHDAVGNLPSPAYWHHVYTIANRGEDTLLLGDGRVRVSSEAMQAWLSIAPPAKLEPGAEAEFVITTFGEAFGPVTYTLAIVSNDPRVPFFTLFADGETAPAPDLELWLEGRPLVGGEPFDVGAFSLRERAAMPVVVKNVGRSSLVVRPGTFEQVAPASTATLTFEGGTVAPGGEMAGTLSWTLLHEGLAEARLRLASNDPDQPELVVPFFATGVDGALDGDLGLRIVRSPLAELPVGGRDDVGAIAVGAVARRSWQVRNDSRAALVVSGAVATQQNVAVRQLSAGTSIANRAVSELGYELTPTALGPFSFDVVLDPTDEGARFTVSGVGVSRTHGLAVYRAGRAFGDEAWDDVGGTAKGVPRPLVVWLVADGTGDGPGGVSVSEVFHCDARVLNQPPADVAPGAPVPIALMVTPSGDDGWSLRFTVTDAAGKVMHAHRIVSPGAVPSLRLVSDEHVVRPPHTADYLRWFPPGEQVVLRYAVQNRGTGMLKLLGEPTLTDLDGRGVCVGARMIATWDIMPGSESAMEVTLAPDDEGFQCLLAVASDDPAVPRYEVVLVGLGRGAQVADGGCATGGEGASWLVLVVLALLGRRARIGAAAPLEPPHEGVACTCRGAVHRRGPLGPSRLDDDAAEHRATHLDGAALVDAPFGTVHVAATNKHGGEPILEA